MKTIKNSIAYIVAYLNSSHALAENTQEKKSWPIVYSHLFLIILCLQSIQTTYCQDSIDETQSPFVVEKEIPKISFDYENENLDNIINQLALLKNINVIFPVGDGINTKLTLAIEEKVTIDEAWNLLTTILDVAGFIMVPNGNTIKIIKSPSKDISREPMPTYIGVDLNQIPKTDQPIRYLCYLSNIKVSDAQENELNGILKDLLPENALYKADPVTNGLLIVAKANDIHGVMQIITELDQVGFQEKVDILSLNHTSAAIVAQLLNEQILKVEGANPYRLDTKKPKEVPYFSGFTKVIAEERLNKLILLGRTQSVERLKDFIKKYIDIAPDSGRSILHIYQLQYLDATQFAGVLTRIIEGSRAGGPSQARGGEKVVTGTERFFEDVVIIPDRPRESEELKYYGGNKLVIAARNDDWKQIKKLIEELDTPQPQVLIEVLIADLTVEDERMLGAMTRTPAKTPLPDQIGFQAAMLAPALPNQLPNPTTIDSDLLSNGYTSTETLANPTPGTNNIADFATSGTTMLSLNDNDGKTWSILELLQVFSHSKILSHPHVIATNNKEALVAIGEQRLLKDAVAGSLNPIITFIKIDADLRVKITPRISAANTVNLQVLIDINEFIPGAAADNAQTIRKLETNANIKSGGIFALGGLIKTNTVDSVAHTPLLGKIPILGWFFKNRSTNITKNNLTVFICPTIIEPRLRGGVNKYTQDYIDVAQDDSSDEMFGSLREPITRWFFTSTAAMDSSQIIDEFTARNIDPNEVKEGDIHKDKKAAAEEAYYTKNDVPSNNQDNNDNALKNIIQNDPNPFLKA